MRIRSFVALCVFAAIAAAPSAFGAAGAGQAPVASFIPDPHDLRVDFYDQSSDADGSVVAWHWQFGDGATSDVQNPSHRYGAYGTYHVALAVTDDGGNSTSTAQDIAVVPMPVPVIAWSPATPLAGAPTRIDGSGSTSSAGAITDYQWYFRPPGGGPATGATGAKVVKTFNGAGTWTIELDVTDATGSSDVTIQDLVVADGGHTFTSDVLEVDPGGTINVSGNGCADVSLPPRFVDLQLTQNGLPVGGVVHVGGDGSWATAFVVPFTALPGSAELTARCPNPRIEPLPFDYVPIQLTILGIALPPTPPTAAFTFSPGAPVSGQAVSFDGTGSSATGTTIASAHWDFGDGTTTDQASGDAGFLTMSHTYSAVGSKTASLTVTDGHGLTHTAMHDVVVSAANKPPLAAFTFSPASPKVGGAVSFDGTGSSDPDGSIASYSWDFGDGGTSTESKPQHKFSTAGIHQVALTVSDDKGAITVVSKGVSVSGPANLAPLASFTYDPLDPAVGEQVSFDASASSDPDDGIASYSWSFGDGSTGSGVKPSHAYPSAGPSTVTLTVQDHAGASSTASLKLSVVSNTAPTAAFLVTPPAPVAGDTLSFDASGSSDPDGDALVSYAWSYGDGATGSGVTSSHQYKSSGTFTVTLDVTDSQDATGSKAKAVFVDRAEGAGRVVMGTVTERAVHALGVLDARRPVASAKVVLLDAGGKQIGSEFTQKASSSTPGTYEFDRVPACPACSIEVLAPGGAVEDRRTVSAAVSPSVTTIDLEVSRLTQGAVLTGRVLAPPGPCLQGRDPSGALVACGIRTTEIRIVDLANNTVLFDQKKLPQVGCAWPSHDSSACSAGFGLGGPGGPPSKVSPKLDLFGRYRAGDLPAGRDVKITLYENGSAKNSTVVQLPTAVGDDVVAPDLYAAADPSQVGGRVLTGVVTEHSVHVLGWSTVSHSVGGAKVQLVDASGRSIARTTSVDTGKSSGPKTDLPVGAFELGGLKPCSGCLLEVTSATGAVSDAVPVTLGDDPSVTVQDLELGRVEHGVFLTGEALVPPNCAGGPCHVTPTEIRITNPLRSRDVYFDGKTLPAGCAWPSTQSAPNTRGIACSRSGSGAFGEYRADDLPAGQAVTVTLYESGVAVDSETVALPASGEAVAPPLQGISPVPSGGSGLTLEGVVTESALHLVGVHGVEKRKVGGAKVRLLDPTGHVVATAQSGGAPTNSKSGAATGSYALTILKPCAGCTVDVTTPEGLEERQTISLTRVPSVTIANLEVGPPNRAVIFGRVVPPVDGCGPLAGPKSLTGACQVQSTEIRVIDVATGRVLFSDKSLPGGCAWLSGANDLCGSALKGASRALFGAYRVGPFFLGETIKVVLYEGASPVDAALVTVTDPVLEVPDLQALDPQPPL